MNVNPDNLLVVADDFMSASDAGLALIRARFDLKCSNRTLFALREYYKQIRKTPLYFEICVIDGFWYGCDVRNAEMFAVETEGHYPEILKALFSLRRQLADKGERLTPDKIIRFGSSAEKKEGRLAVLTSGGEGNGAFGILGNALAENVDIEFGFVSAKPDDAANAGEVFSQVQLPLFSGGCGESGELFFAPGFVKEQPEKDEKRDRFAIVGITPKPRGTKSEAVKKYAELLKKLSKINIGASVVGSGNLLDALLKITNAFEIELNGDESCIRDAFIANDALFVTLPRHSLNALYKIAGQGMEVLILGSETSKSVSKIRFHEQTVFEFRREVLVGFLPLNLVALCTKSEESAPKTFEEVRDNVLKKYKHTAAFPVTGGDFTVKGGVLYAPFGGKNAVKPTQIYGLNVLEKDIGVVCAFSASTVSGNAYYDGMLTAAKAVLSLICKGVYLKHIVISSAINSQNLNDISKLGGVFAKALSVGYFASKLKIRIDEAAFPRGGEQGRVRIAAAATTRPEQLIESKIRQGQKIFFFPLQKSETEGLDCDYFSKLCGTISSLVTVGAASCAEVVEDNLLETLSACAFAGGTGITFIGGTPAELTGGEGGIVISAEDTPDIPDYIKFVLLGTADDTEEIKDSANVHISVQEAILNKRLTAFEEEKSRCEEFDVMHTGFAVFPRGTTAMPRVFIADMEYGTGKLLHAAFTKAGAAAERMPIDEIITLEELNIIAQKIRNCEIVAFGGDVFPKDVKSRLGRILLNNVIKDALNDHIADRGGLVLGIGDGFRALIEAGFISGGLSEMYFTAERSVKGFPCRIPRIKVSSEVSPFFWDCDEEKSMLAPVSLGCGKLVISDGAYRALANSGQIASRFVNINGKPTDYFPYNPSGNSYAAESLTNEGGKVLGRFSHPERLMLLKNVSAVQDYGFFDRGVKYFK
ncbi:MAG: phosphoribosylformylglycinamidine synthase subunit PurQ [Christensenellaceae bacterium]|nr:phosphoribosylformylglycinamidine synthase subunit PurQ [Christensenellaceae bacterium]